MSIKKTTDKLYKQFFLNADGKVSVTKIGLQVAAAGGAIVAFPASMAAVGITVVLPPALALAAKWAIGIGTYIAANRAKDTLDASAKK